MARLIVNAAVAWGEAHAVLVVSVSGGDDGLPRTGLTPENFSIAAFGPGESGAPEALSVVRSLEGPPGVYVLELQPAADHSGPEPVLAIAVSGSVEGGWADDRGQTLVASGSTTIA